MKWLKPVKILTSVLPKAKEWIFSDGKFQVQRALVLLLALALLGVMTHYLGADTTTEVVDMLDDVSDVIGYAP